MISTVEVIEKSKAISDIGLEIQTLNNAYANHAKAMSETMEKIKELKAKQDELARNLIQECNKPLTVDDLDTDRIKQQIMNYEEFVETIEKDAEQYAKSCVCDADEHDDAVEAIAADYIEGAMRAFEILNG